MGIIGKDFKYKIIKNFLSKDEQELLNTYTEIKHRTNFDSFSKKDETTSTSDTSFYGEPIFDSLMLKKKFLMEKEVGKKLLPTYSFWRMYTKYADLGAHKDRPACEISVTINIGNDGTRWPIFIDGNPVDLEKGDAAIYLGCELEHYREEFKGDWCSQVFLHYVDEQGPYKDHYADKRGYWGMVK
tara:strand:+ start:2521 stop:3075 length:555 start_codon:yes stop_codon:yes gene_type:complete